MSAFKSFLRSVILACILASPTSGAFAGQTTELTSELTKTNQTISEANLAANLQLFTDTDGGVYAVKVVITNISKTNDLILGLSDVRVLNLAVFIYVDGIDITKKLPKPKNYEGHALEMRLNRCSSEEWFVRIADHVENIEKVPTSKSAKVAVSFLFGYWMADGETRTSVYTQGSFVFMLAPITITPNALRGDPTEKYEKSLIKPRK